MTDNLSIDFHVSMADVRAAVEHARKDRLDQIPVEGIMPGLRLLLAEVVPEKLLAITDANGQPPESIVFTVTAKPIWRKP